MRMAVVAMAFGLLVLSCGAPATRTEINADSLLVEHEQEIAALWEKVREAMAHADDLENDLAEAVETHQLAEEHGKRIARLERQVGAIREALGRGEAALEGFRREPARKGVVGGKVERRR